MSLFLAVFDGLDARQVFRLDEAAPILIGRTQEADVPLQDRSVSRRHCEAEVHGERLHLRDVGSRNGTWVYGTRVGSDSREVGLGAVVTLGGARLTVLEAPGISAEWWDNCRDVSGVMGYLPGRRGGRKLRLLACAFTRLLGPMLTSRWGQEVVEAAERHADGAGSLDEVQEACAAAVRVQETLPLFEQKAIDVALKLAEPGPREAVLQTLRCLRHLLPPEPSYCDLARDILGPFGPPTSIEKPWLEGDRTVARMAQVIYAEQLFEDLPILADALEDAGCDDPGLLAHCRSGKPHARGCWGLDALLNAGRCRSTEMPSLSFSSLT